MFLGKLELRAFSKTWWQSMSTGLWESMPRSGTECHLLVINKVPELSFCYSLHHHVPHISFYNMLNSSSASQLTEQHMLQYSGWKHCPLKVAILYAWGDSTQRAARSTCDASCHEAGDGPCNQSSQWPGGNVPLSGGSHGCWETWKQVGEINVEAID